jgi:hypothetical protein
MSPDCRNCRPKRRRCDPALHDHLATCSLTAVKNWLKTRSWTIALAIWIVFSDRVEPFRSRFWLSLLGGIVICVLTIAVEVGIVMLMKSRTRPSEVNE